MKRPMRLKPLMIALCVAGVMTSANAQAGERESLEQLRATTLNLIQLLVEQGILTKEKADVLIQQAQASAQAAAVPEKVATADTETTESGAPVRVQYVPEFLKKQLKEEVRKEVMAKLNFKAGERLGLPDWLDRITWEGDLRLRYQSDRFPEGNDTPENFRLKGEDIDNTSSDRNRYRVRARLGANVKISDDFSGGIRIITGGVDDPVSPNQTLGMNSGSSKFNFGLDRAFIKYQPKPWLAFNGGRIANPWFGTDLVWDPDLSFDGATASVMPRINDYLKAFATIGAFPIEETERSRNNGANTNRAKDKWLYGAQVGFELGAPTQTTFKLGAAYYDYQNVTGIQNQVGLTELDGTAPQFRQKGNTLFVLSNPADPLNGPFGLASEFREINLTGSLDIASFDPVRVILTGDYVKNVGFNEKDIRAKNPSNSIGGDTGWMGRIQVGMPNTFKKDDWNVFAAYKHLESNAVLDAFTDSDFRLGGTNAKGWIVGGNYGVDKNAWLSLRWLSADQIVGPAYSVDVLLFDLNAKF